MQYEWLDISKVPRVLQATCHKKSEVIQAQNPRVNRKCVFGRCKSNACGPVQSPECQTTQIRAIGTVVLLLFRRLPFCAITLGRRRRKTGRSVSLSSVFGQARKFPPNFCAGSSCLSEKRRIERRDLHFLLITGMFGGDRGSAPNSPWQTVAFTRNYSAQFSRCVFLSCCAHCWKREALTFWAVGGLRRALKKHWKVRRRVGIKCQFPSQKNVWELNKFSSKVNYGVKKRQMQLPKSALVSLLFSQEPHLCTHWL